MSSGPSKQELEMYWQNSRRYFDELAAHYKQNDPQYYKEFIEPFYTNPFQGSSQTTRSSGSSAKPILAVIVAVMLLFVGIGAAAIYFFMSNDSGKKQQEEYTKQLEKDLQKEDTKIKEPGKEEQKLQEELNKTKEPPTETPSDDPSELSPEDNFIIGSKYISEKKYDKAEYHLKKIKKGDKYHEQAQQLLENMHFLRQYNK